VSKPALALRIVQSGEPAPAICVGDVVRTGDNKFPHYEVIAVSGGRVWLRDVQYGVDQVVAAQTVHGI